MNDDQNTLIWQVVTGLMSSLALLLQAVPAIRKVKSENKQTNAVAADTAADAAGKIQDSAVELYETYKTECRDLREQLARTLALYEEERMKAAKLKLELEAAKHERNEIIDGCFVLRKQLTDREIDPLFTPPGFYL